tara:strand:+ start:248 stop:472 length:225 start_codon:yes stop_codon:yes gene_type:complete
VETSIDLCWRLKQEVRSHALSGPNPNPNPNPNPDQVGSYALMGSSGFKHLDFLNCCKFAEGDSRVLMQKMVRLA